MRKNMPNPENFAKGHPKKRHPDYIKYSKSTIPNLHLGGSSPNHWYQDPPVGVSNGLPQTTYRLPDRAPLRGSWYVTVFGGGWTAST